jgi:hypothetical protein
MVADGRAVMKPIMSQRSANAPVNIAHSGKFHELGVRTLSDGSSSEHVPRRRQHNPRVRIRAGDSPESQHLQLIGRPDLTIVIMAFLGSIDRRRIDVLRRSCRSLRTTVF